MDTQLQQLETRLQQAELRFQQAETSIFIAQRRARRLGGLALAALLGCAAAGIRPAAQAQGYGVTLQTLMFRIAALNTTLSALETTVRGQTTSIGTLQTATQALETKTQYQSVSGASTIFSGTNVYIQNGLGATNGYPQDPSSTFHAVTNGLGNLIIGYNAAGHLDYGNGLPVVQDIRTGSHDLILGDKGNYSSFGGLIAGKNNMVSAPYASVSAGVNNLAGGSFSTVSGGSSNIAMGYLSSISGGNSNLAQSPTSSISGGYNLTQSDSFGWSAGSLHSP